VIFLLVPVLGVVSVLLLVPVLIVVLIVELVLLLVVHISHLASPAGSMSAFPRNMYNMYRKKDLKVYEMFDIIF
jgi:hypothetical protein